MPPSTLASCANVIAQLLRITHLTVQRFNLLSIISESVVWDAFVVSLDIDGATPLKGLVLDGTNFTNTYSFHRMLSQSRLQYLEELFIRDCLIGNLPRGLDGYEEHTIRYPWPRYSTSLKTLTILRSPTVFNTLYDKRCPVDITGVRMLQYIMRQERDLELEKFRREFNSLTHLKSRGNKIAVEHFSKPALPLLTHYYIELSIRFPCLDIHHAAPNLRYVILDTQDIYPRPNNFQAFRDELLKIIIDAPLPNRVRFVVVVPRWALYQAREGLNLVNQNRPLEIYAPCTLRDPTMSHVDYDATLVEVS
ncbi:hypothetical protein VNI00_010527 [Paramarasmius palmivorus]|uniref:Uncharacterized protein n=1 Tax=Paramarasmius palmivorus TaxID=297713 RepID=A0AAW0CGZ2_9AGAR